MNFPRLKNALLCRILVYVVVLGGFIAPIIIVANLNFVPETLKIIVGIIFALGLLVYLIVNLPILMTMDILFATIRCYNNARKTFALPKSFLIEKSENRISRFGKQCEQSAIYPRPQTLVYSNNFPISCIDRPIEKTIITYSTDYLDMNEYQAIINSAKTNSKTLACKNRTLFLKYLPKKSDIKKITVIIIYAKSVSEDLRARLFDFVCKSNGGDEFDNAIIPCVVDLEKQRCTFDSMKIPYTGFQYAAKNSAIKIIKKYIFSNRLRPSDSTELLKPLKDYNPEQSLWSFWRMAKKEIKLDIGKDKKRFKKMTHKELIFEGGYIYLKWQERGIWLSVEVDEELKKAKIDPVNSWYYPKSNKIAKDIVKEIKGIINSYFFEQGYTTEYISYE